MTTPAYGGNLGDSFRVDVANNTFDMMGKRVVDVDEPTAQTDAATKEYVDSANLGGQPMTTLGDIMVAGVGGILSRLAGDTSNVRKFLSTLSIGGVATAPAWYALLAADIPTLTAAKISDFDSQVRTSRLDQMAAPTSAVSMGANKITAVADPTTAQDAATKAYVDDSVREWYQDTGAKNAAVVTLSPVPAAYVAGQSFAVRIVATNDAAVTIDCNGLGAKAVVTHANAALVAGELVATNVYRMTYDGTAFRLDSLCKASEIPGFDTQVRTSRLDQMAAPTSSVALNAQKLTGVADPTLAQDAVTLQSMRSGFRSGSGGAKNAYTAGSVSPALVANTAGTLIGVLISAATNDAASTLAVSGLAALPIKRRDGTDVQAGDIVSGSTYMFLCEGTTWVLVSPPA